MPKSAMGEARVAMAQADRKERAVGARSCGLTPEVLSELFGPDLVLPEQFFAPRRSDSYLSGEKALMLAVLEDAIRCFQEHLRNPRANPRLLSQQAESWIRAEDYDWPFSFNNVCEALGMNPSALREALLRWKAARSAEASSSSGRAPRKVYRLHLRTRRAHRCVRR